MTHHHHFAARLFFCFCFFPRTKNSLFLLRRKKTKQFFFCFSSRLEFFDKEKNGAHFLLFNYAGCAIYTIGVTAPLQNLLPPLSLSLCLSHTHTHTHLLTLSFSPLCFLGYTLIGLSPRLLRSWTL